MDKNKLYYGDNLDILRRYVQDETVDLVYLDPPFNSNQSYNVLFAEHDGAGSSAQIKAFEDTWRWDEAAAAAYQYVVEYGPERVSLVMLSFRNFLGDTDMTAYLAMMAQRLIELHRVLKPTGSLYLHCDPTASHYLKVLMDAVFEPGCFRNEIIWSYRRWPSPSKRFQQMHDAIFFYTKSSDGPGTFNVEYEPNSPSYVKRFKGKTQMLDPKTKTRKITLDAESKGLPRRDVWDISIIAGFKKERLGYPTQKPEALLERIISASSSEGDLVLDPFCGCGTTVAVAERLKRRWIGIDITHLAITLMKNRLRDAFGEAVRDSYDVIGEPVSLPDAAALAESDPYQFQWWALGLVGARPAEQKKGADKGIDGRLFFHDEGESGKTKQIVFSVKAGRVTVSHVRDLRGVLEREAAAIGVLISMEEPTQPMRAEAAGAGFYSSPGWSRDYPRLQLLMIEELLSGKRVDYPPSKQVDVTYKRARRARRANPSATKKLELGASESAPDD
ncbi:MAG: DNA methyltransferase [Planctomycetota bacterium]